VTHLQIIASVSKICQDSIGACGIKNIERERISIRQIQYNFYVPKSEQTYRPKNPDAPKMATFTPAFEERPPGPASVALFAVIRGRNVENARQGVADALNADSILALFVNFV
jgi:hypothetical protein